MTPTKKAENVLRIVLERRKHMAASRLADAVMQEIHRQRDRRRFRAQETTCPDK